MALENTNPTATSAWRALQEHYAEMKHAKMQEMFAADKGRAQQFNIQWNDFTVDYSKNIINQKTIQLLQNLAKEVNLAGAVDSYFGGDAINRTEGRAVLHTALRAPENADVRVDGVNVMPEIYAVKNKIKQFCEAVITGSKTGYTGKPFTDVVNIGIGGSDLGPAMVAEALKSGKEVASHQFVIARSAPIGWAKQRSDVPTIRRC